MGNALHKFHDTVEEFPHRHDSRVTDELNRIAGLLRAICPPDAQVSFSFDGRLQAHIDFRKLEQLYIVESVLPTLGEGLFHSLTHRPTPHHPFMKRLSAFVQR